MNALADQVLPETARALPPALELDLALRTRIAGGSDRDRPADRRPRAPRRGLVVRHRIGGAAQGDGRRRSRDTRGVSRYRMAVRGDAGLSRHADRHARPARRPFDQAAGSRRCRARIPIANCGSPIPMPAAGSARWSRWHARWRRSRPGSTDASVFRAACAPTLPWSRTTVVRLKFNPFANVSREEIEAIYRLADLPPHPLAASGYLSVGCMPCSSRTSPDEDARAGRWRGRAKTECGIHTVKTS